MGTAEQLQLAVKTRLEEIFDWDSRQESAVIQAISLFFWQHLPQWVEQIGISKTPFIIALTGPSGCGKSFIREVLVEQISRISAVSAFTQDNYYRDFEADFHHLPLDRFYDEIDFDDPAHIRFKHLHRDLQRLKAQPLGSILRIPRLRFGTPIRKPSIIEDDVELSVTPFIITEGIHAFYDTAVLPHYDLKIYVDVEEKTRRQRWLERNRLENRGTTDNMWSTTVECLQKHILPTRQSADLVINNNLPQEKVAHLLEYTVQSLTFPLAQPHREIA
jgi:uridine kinase